MSIKRPALSTSQKTDGYVNVAEFRSRIVWMNETAFTGQKSEFRDQVLSQNPTHYTTTPLALSVCLDRLLSGMTRIYPSSTGHSVNLRKDYLSMRDVLRSMNDQVIKQVERARQAMQRLQALNSLTYVVEVEHEVNFDQVVRHQVASPQYLNWVAGYMALSRYDQRCVRTYCEVEGEWWWRTEGLEAFPSYAPQGDTVTEDVGGLLAQASHELAGMRAQMSSAAVELLDTRSAPASGEWLWLQPWGVNALSWPATGTLSGDETNHDLETEAQYWDALGRSLNWLPFDTIVDAASDTPESIETYRIATQAWAECLDAGQTIRRLASVLRACSLTIKVPVCDRCYRYVGSEQHVRCHVHVTRSNERTQATRAADIARRYHAQLDALRLQVGNEVIYADIAQVLATHWKVRAKISSGGSLTQANAALELHSHGLQKMIRLLKPVVGSVLHKRMSALGDVLKLHVTHILDHNAQTDDQDGFNGEPQLGVVEESLRLLTPPGFFKMWFGGLVPDGVEHFLHQGVDPSHPLLRQTVRSRTRSTKKQSIYAFNLNAVLNDLLRHRVWLEIGGEEADQALLRGEALPSDRPRPRMDISLAKVLRAKGLSFRQIADELGVSGAAVHKALNKSTTNSKKEQP
jgi:hypothetical protein